MPKGCLFILFSLVLNESSFAQKPVLDSATFGKWPEINNPKITDDGKYSMFSVSDNLSGVRSLNILSNEGSWKFIANNIHSEAIFSRDSKEVFFVNEHDSLMILKLGTGKASLVPNIRSFKVSESKTDEWIAYVGRQDGELTFWNTSNNRKYFFLNTNFHFFTKNGESIILGTYDSATQRKTLKWFNLSTGDTKIVWTGREIWNFEFDDSCIRLSFLGSESLADIGKPSLFYFKLGMNASVCKVSGDSLFKCGMTLYQNGLQFSKSGSKLLFAVQKLNGEIPGIGKSGTGVTIWNYKDSVLQSIQRRPDYQDFKPLIVEALDLSSSRIIIIKKADEVFENDGVPFENYKLVSRTPEDPAHWKDPFSLKLLSLVDGKVVIIRDSQFVQLFVLSPDERFVVWFDPALLAYYNYEISTGTIRKIGNSIPVKLYDEVSVNMGRSDMAAYGLCGWSLKDHSVYLYDKFDIWKVDLFDIDKPVNVTNGYGRLNSLVLGRIDLERVGENINLDNVDRILLSEYNVNTKDNAIAVFDKDFKSRSKDIAVGPYSYCIVRTGVKAYDMKADGFPPIKARGCEKYLVRRMNASEFPNVFLTSDFRNFEQLSFLIPDKKYNWMMSKLISWKKFDGLQAQGILYLPEDFDSTKRYPVLFECYELMSNDLNDYLTPGVSEARINIPYYVSNGYLVFEPDVTWHKRDMGTGFINSIVSAKEYLSKFKWVDSTKIGLQGHSFGGWVANYIATHTHAFAAVCAASGFTDAISGYDDLRINGRSCQTNFELGQEGDYGIGVGPWANPELYIANSSLFGVGNTTTPLLLMAGDLDPAVPFVQSRELYLALRRAGKRVWFLEYENDGHVLDGSNAQDFSNRMKQFFDHYLKNVPPPLWMTKGVPYSGRVDDDEYKLDTTGADP